MFSPYRTTRVYYKVVGLSIDYVLSYYRYICEDQELKVDDQVKYISHTTDTFASTWL